MSVIRTSTTNHVENIAWSTSSGSDAIVPFASNLPLPVGIAGSPEATSGNLLDTAKLKFQIFLIDVSCVLRNGAERVDNFIRSINLFARKRNAGENFRQQLPSMIALSQKSDLDPDEAQQIRRFFNRYRKLPEKHFNRTEILGGRERLQRILSPELDAILRREEEDASLKENQEHRLQVAVERAKLAAKMGMSQRRAGGCNGAVLVKSLEGVYIGVFKPSQQNRWNPVRAFKNRFGQARLLDNTKNKEQVAEVAMHVYDETFGFNLAPAATMTKIQGEKGAFLEFLGGYRELATVREAFEQRTEYTKEEKILWQKATVAIFASLNFDPHDENLFVRINEEGRLVGLKIIDAGNAIRVNRLPRKGSKGHRNKPGMLKISREKFEPEVVNFVRDRMTEKNLNEFIGKLREKHANFWTPEMDLLHRNTLRVMREGILSGRIETPEQLLNILTQDRYNEFLS